MTSLITKNPHKVEEFSILKPRRLKGKLKSLDYLEPLLPDHLRSLKNFYHFISRLQVQERIVFIIAKETCNNNTIYEKLLEKELYLLKTFNIEKKYNKDKENQKGKKSILKNNTRNGSYQGEINALVDRGIIKKNTKCPHCEHQYTIKKDDVVIEKKRLPEFCVDCGLPIFLQSVKFKKKSNRPYHTLILTPKGKEYLKEIIDSYFKAVYFSLECLKFFNSKFNF